MALQHVTTCDACGKNTDAGDGIRYRLMVQYQSVPLKEGTEVLPLGEFPQPAPMLHFCNGTCCAKYFVAKEDDLAAKRKKILADQAEADRIRKEKLEEAARANGVTGMTATGQANNGQVAAAAG